MKVIVGVLGAIAAIVGIVAFGLTLYDRAAENVPASEALLLEHTFDGATSTAVVRDFDPALGLEYYIDKEKLTYATPRIDVEVESQVNGEWIKLAPYLVVEIKNTEPMPEDLDFLSIVPTESVASASQDWFFAMFYPQREG